MFNIEGLGFVDSGEAKTLPFFHKEEFDALPPEHKDQISFFDGESTRKLYKQEGNIDLLCTEDGWGNSPFDGGCYESVTKFEKWKTDEELKKWLYQRGVPFKQEILFIPTFGTEDTPIMLLTWKMLIKYADNFFWADNVVITAFDCSWCLFYHHDSIMTFARGRKYDWEMC